MSPQKDFAFRYDSFSLKNYELDSEGYLRFIAPIAKVGNLRYMDANGDPYDEYVSEKTLVDSLESFKTKPVTYLHPREKVTPQNSRKYARGLTGYSGYFDGSFLWLTGTVTDQELIQKALNGDCKEISCGYDALIKTDSLGKKEQVKRLGNHVALVPKGRAGKDVSLKLDHDSEERASRDSNLVFIEFCCDDLGSLKVPDQLFDHFKSDSIIIPLTNPTKGSNEAMTQILLSDQVFTIEGDDAANLKAELTNFVKSANEWKAQADQLDSLKSQLAASNDQVVTLISDKAKVDGELKATKIKLDEVLEASQSRLDQDSINTAIQTRLSLWGEVLPYIQKTDSAYKVDYSLDEHKIRLEYLKVRKPDQCQYLDSIDLNTESGQKLLEGMYLGLKPTGDDKESVKTHADHVLNSIKTSQDSGNDSEGVDFRTRLRLKLEGKATI